MIIASDCFIIAGGLAAAFFAWLTLRHDFNHCSPQRLTRIKKWMRISVAGGCLVLLSGPVLGFAFRDRYGVDAVLVFVYGLTTMLYMSLQIAILHRIRVVERNGSAR